MSTMNDNNMESPCIRHCCLNEQLVCIGCFRSLEEIKQWTVVDNKTRQIFLYNAKARQNISYQKNYR